MRGPRVEIQVLNCNRHESNPSNGLAERGLADGDSLKWGNGARIKLKLETQSPDIVDSARGYFRYTIIECFKFDSVPSIVFLFFLMTALTKSSSSASGMGSVSSLTKAFSVDEDGVACSESRTLCLVDFMARLGSVFETEMNDVHNISVRTDVSIRSPIRVQIYLTMS